MNHYLPKLLPRPRLALLVAGLAGIAAALTGCRSAGQPASASFASVVIAGRDIAQIHTTAEAVFQADGYRTLRSAGGVMVFEKEGSRQNQVAYSGLGGSFYGEMILVRVRAEIVDLGAGSHRLQCKTFMVRHAGDSFFEEEIPLSNLRGGPYQKLLDEVARRLK